MKNFLKKIKILSILVLPFFFTSCIDYLESLSYEDGKYHVVVKLTTSKSILELAEYDGEDLFSKITENIANIDSANVTMIDADDDIGIMYVADVDSKNPGDNKDIIPEISKNKIYIPFLLSDLNDTSLQNMQNDADEFSLMMTEMFFSTSKVRILVDKNIVKNIKSVYFAGSKNVPITFFDFGKQYYLEIPMTLLLSKEMPDFSRIVIETL